MNAKTLEAIKRHGESLLLAFPNCAERDPVALCKKLRRIETSVSRVTTDYCNGVATLEQCDAACDQAKLRVSKLLTDGKTLASIFFINRDPRGCALKLEDEWTRQWNDAQRKANKATIYTDWGGYGLLAPDLNQ